MFFLPYLSTIPEAKWVPLLVFVEYIENRNLEIILFGPNFNLSKFTEIPDLIF